MKSNDARIYGGVLFWLLPGAILFALVMILPSGVTAWFDGLPWVGKTETLFLISITPFLIILGYRFLSSRPALIFLSGLLALKLFMFFVAPSSGLLVKVYPGLSLEQVKQNNWHRGLYQAVTSGEWVKTYATNWNKNASGILQTPWTNKLHFPMDWFLPYGASSKNVYQQFDELNSWVEIEGTLLLPAGKRFALIAEGVEEGTLRATNEEGEEFVLSPATSIEETTNRQYQVPQSGGWLISGKLRFKGKNWSLIPVLVNEDGMVSSDLGRDVLWQDKSVLTVSPGTLRVYKYLSWIIDAGICLFFLVWGFWTARFLVQEQVLTLPLATFATLAAVTPVILSPLFTYVLGIVRLADATRFSHLGVSTTLASVGFLLWAYLREDYRNFQPHRMSRTVFLFFGPALLFFFANNWWFHLEQWYLWTTGDDWISYQYFAHKIIVNGEWLHAGEGVFQMQPLYRYFVGIYHWLFGQSPFAQHMADVWCVLGATTLLASLTVKFRLSPLTAFFTSICYLMICLIGAFRYHIGNSLVEHHAMIFMMLAAWYLYRARKGGAYKIFLATLFGIFGYWTRQDHLGAIAGLAFLALEPIEGPTGGWREYWDRFILRSKNLIWYWGGGILSVLVLCLRNWWLGGAFFVTSTLHPNYDLPKGNYYLILTGNEWPNFPSISGIVVTLGVFVALTALVWRPKAIFNFPLGLGIALVGLLAPYVFLYTGGYPPRFSIHLLPLALLSLMILLNNLSEGLKFSLKLHCDPPPET